MPSPWQALTAAIGALVFLLGLWLQAVSRRVEERLARKRVELDTLHEQVRELNEHRHRLELELQSATSQTVLLGSKHTALTDQISKMVTRVEFESFETQVTKRLDKIDACLERIADEMAARREARK